jgi:hypothetical protein
MTIQIDFKAAFNNWRIISMKWDEVRKSTKAEIKSRAAQRKRKATPRAEIEARLEEEDRARREDKSTHEISNKSLKDIAEHRRKYRGEELVDDGVALASNGRTVKRRKRVEYDKRLIEMLGDGRVDAMSVIRSGYMMIANGTGMQTFDPLKIRGGGGDIDSGLAVQMFYWGWARELQVRRLDHAMCIAIVVECLTLNACAEVYRRDKRKVSDNLIACLDVALKMGVLKLLKRED